MRVVRKSGGLGVRAVSGTYVVSFGFDLPEAECAGLLGFSMHRTDHTAGDAGWLRGMKAFPETDPGLPAGSSYSTADHPVQSFQWADYGAEPGHRYTYRLLARKGSPRTLETYAEVSIPITAESPADGDHDVFFNRGAAASQEYARRFGDRAPDKVGSQPIDHLRSPAFVWLSRGLYEAIVDVISSADPAHHSLRIAAYEFTFKPFLLVVKDAVDRGVDVRVVYDGREKTAKRIPGLPNRNAVKEVGLDGVCIERTKPKSPISHNKFIVRLRDGTPEAVWTGGTNFSEGGIFGHSNVGHHVEDAAIAAQYLAYWDELAADPDDATLTAAVEAISPVPPKKPPKGTTCVFSPRSKLDALERYAEYAMGAKQGLMMTFAFGMNDIFKDVYRSSTAPFRLALLERATRPMKEGSPERVAEERKIQDLRNLGANVFAIGNMIKTNDVDGWVKERLSGLNGNVKYIHNKFMLVDPLGNDPLVIAGSANFSDASTTGNDENMIIVRGNRRVADIYLGEFMRLWSHHAFRESLTWPSANRQPKPLRTDDWWKDAHGNGERNARRVFFAPG
jgi:phosphatidylserine/phosphatidylglycerophosphate/cardiolipin synthase-like enzyme